MNCDEREEQLLLFALGETEGPEQEGFRAHLQGCPRCQGRLAEMQDVLAMLPMALPPVAVPASARRRVMERVDTQGSSQSALRHNAVRPIARSGGRLRGWMGAALAGGAIAASMAAILYSVTVSALRKSLDNVNNELALLKGELREMRTHALPVQQPGGLTNNPALKFAMLKGLDSQPAAQGRLIWDAKNRVFWFSATNLKTLTPGRAYELWLINSENKPIPAATFTVDLHGMGMVECDMREDPGVVKISAVTEEPARGSTIPTPPLLLSGKLE
jgi:anti-sigma-K factor RskA